MRPCQTLFGRDRGYAVCSMYADLADRRCPYLDGRCGSCPMMPDRPAPVVEIVDHGVGIFSGS